MAALDGTGIFSGKDVISRVEGAKKGSAYQNVCLADFRHTFKLFLPSPLMKNIFSIYGTYLDSDAWKS